MDAKTLKALKGSIRKWERIVGGTGEDHGGSNCPLCQMFVYSSPAPFACGGCPVKERTGRPGCDGTPYFAFLATSGFRRKANTPEAKAAAQAELDFLRSLLPPAEEA